MSGRTRIHPRLFQLPPATVAPGGAVPASSDDRDRYGPAAALVRLATLLLLAGLFAPSPVTAFQVPLAPDPDPEALAPGPAPDGDWERWGPTFPSAFYFGSPGEVILRVTPDGAALLTLPCVGPEAETAFACAYRASATDSRWSVWWSGNEEIRGLWGGDPSFLLTPEGLHRRADGEADWTVLPLSLPGPDARDGFRSLLDREEVPAEDRARLRALFDEGPRRVTEILDLFGERASGPMALAGTLQGDLLLATDDGVFSSPDHGDRWSVVAGPVHDGSALRFHDIVSPGSGQVTLVGEDLDYTIVVLHSTDGGATWHEVRTPEGARDPILRTPNGRYLTEGLVSHDGGESWEPVAGGPADSLLSRLPCCLEVFSGGDDLWVQGSGGPVRLAHAGNDWRALRGLPSGWITNAATGPDGSLLVALFDLEEQSLALWRYAEGAGGP